MRNWGGWGLRAVAALLPLTLAACQALIKPHAGDGCDPDCPPGGDCHVHVKACKHPTVMALAHDLDHLEKHIDWYGSAVAKVPDVWGQARLTQYREEFEQQMAAQLGQFSVKLAGSTSRSDQSYLAYAMAISAAAGGIPTLPPLATDAVQRSKGDESYTRVVGKYLGGPDTIGLEPSTELAQRKRFLDLLNQLRRENEGSDTADGPGYSLDLIRIPVSILPGKRTDVGHGAEVTMTINPVLGDDLLPMTFRNLVVNDLVGQIGFPLTRFLDDDRLAKPDERILRTEIQTYLQGLEAGKTVPAMMPPAKGAPAAGVTPQPAKGTDPAKVSPQQLYGARAAERAFSREVPGRPKRAAPPAASQTLDSARKYTQNNFVPTLALPRPGFANGLDTKQAFPSSQLLDVYGYRYGFEIAFGAQQALGDQIDRNRYVSLPDVQAYLREELRAAYQFLAQPQNQHLWHFCDPHLVTTVRSQQWGEVEKRREQFEEEVRNLTDSEKVALSDRKDEKGNLVKDAAGKVVQDPTPVGKTRQFSVTSALAWAILVDSALLTDRLIRDMKETASAKGVGLAGCRQWLPYYLPEPPPDARAAFNEYVKLRWPVRVFALDPYTEQQNVADSLSTRRELQLALSVAFTQGAIGTNALLQYARRLEAEYETIALNNTQVGFGHGENVFGWRFYPRFQTPDTRSNLTVLVRDTLVGGPNKNALLRERRLEPGPRECVAVVMMPSFVPYATVDTTTNWFGLANPKHKVLDHTQAVKLSRTVQAIKTCGPGAAADAACYRDGELGRLLRRAEQLEARLPTQTLITPVPILNTLGGFAMFSNGTTDLAPELYGWYGAPGVHTDKETTLFLVGDQFSPLRTRVIVGNQRVPVPSDNVTAPPAAADAAAADAAAAPAPAATATVHQRLLSRQVMQVTLTPTAEKPLATVTGPDQQRYVTVHVATPYGVTREVLIPVVGGEAAPADPGPKPGFTVGDAKLTVRYALRPADLTRPETPVAVGVEQAKLKFQWVNPLGVAPEKLEVYLVFDVDGVEVTVPCRCGAAATATGAGEVVIEETELKRVAAHLFNQPVVRRRAAEGKLADGLTTKTVLVVPVADPLKPGGQVAQPVAANDQLKVEFKAVGYCQADELEAGKKPEDKCPEPKKDAEKPKEKGKGKGKGKDDDDDDRAAPPPLAPPPTLPLPPVAIPMAPPMPAPVER
ncbi:MAG: hypothetical protein C0501_04165 [Isosphaera sp.]|nr:hypothetical protein [Isosphaera sp.]